jgi:hypothetical protein
MREIVPDFAYKSAHEYRQRAIIHAMNRFLAAHGIEPN